MNEAFRQKLHETFPELYPAGSKYISLGCGDGWDQIVWDLSEKLTAKMKEVDSEQEEDFFYAEVVQIKEKMGGLRFYVSCTHASYSEGFYDLIREAEILSEKTCEGCGTTEDVVRKGYPYWIKTLCSSCAPGFEKNGGKALIKESENV